MILNDWGSQTGLFKSLIANMAGFSWWYWMIEVFIPDYIIQILNSQHGWILLWSLITGIIEVFKVALAQRLLFLSMDMISFTLEGIVLSRCRLTTRHLGATLFKLRLHRICKSHVTASMHHGTWGLMQSHFCSTYWRLDSSHSKWAGPWGLPIAPVKNSRYTSLNPLYWKIHYSVGRVQSS